MRDLCEICARSVRDLCEICARSIGLRRVWPALASTWRQHRRRPSCCWRAAAERCSWYYGPCGGGHARPMAKTLQTCYASSSSSAGRALHWPAGACSPKMRPLGSPIIVHGSRPKTILRLVTPILMHHRVGWSLSRRRRARGGLAKSARDLILDL